MSLRDRIDQVEVVTWNDVSANIPNYLGLACLLEADCRRSGGYLRSMVNRITLDLSVETNPPRVKLGC